MPLTERGLAIQMLSSTASFRRHHPGALNDCKVVLNHLVRKFTEPLQRVNEQNWAWTAEAERSERLEEDHAVPADVIVSEHILSLPDVALTPTDVNVSRLITLLRTQLILVLVTPSQHRQLPQSFMPAAYYAAGGPLFHDPLARYKNAGVETREPAPGVMARSRAQRSMHVKDQAK